MDKIIFKILDTIENEGYEAYIVGGYVRDFLLDKKSKDIDIATNASINVLGKLFCGNKVYEKYSCIKFNIDDFNFSITSYRKELAYENNKPINITNDCTLIEDLNRRDFTINSICMSKNGELIDLLGGINDLKNKTIRMIGNINTKITEDNTRILRAIRFMTILEFNLNKDLEKYIINNKNLINKINYNKKKEELDKIFSSNNAVKFFKFVSFNNMKSNFDIEYENIVQCSNYLCYWAQIECSSNYNFTSYERKIIEKMKSTLS